MIEHVRPPANKNAMLKTDGRDRRAGAGAEGATAPETLRQKDRQDSTSISTSGKWPVPRRPAEGI